MVASPSEEYTQRLKARESRVAYCDKLHVRIGNARLLLAITAVIVAWWSLARHSFSGWWVFMPVALFAGAVGYHARMQRQRTRARRAAAFYRDGLARVEDRWAGCGEGGERFDLP